jgi:catechol 2,3-dioxygenase-like lactoylglutathione lyase family enzyme
MAIRGINKVVVGVQDQARAKRFWSEVVGFEITTTFPTTTRGTGGSR